MDLNKIIIIVDWLIKMAGSILDKLLKAADKNWITTTEPVADETTTSAVV